MKGLAVFLIISTLTACVRHEVPDEFWLDLTESLPKKQTYRHLPEKPTWSDLVKEYILLNGEKAQCSIRSSATVDKISTLRDI